MAEVLFYKRPVPLNRTVHKNLCIKQVPDMKFAAQTHSAPLTGGEFAFAARDLPILFAGTTLEDAGPMAILGLRKHENLLIDADGRWEEGIYVPAFIRRYPFVLAERPPEQPGSDFAVFFDEAFAGFGEDEGERLFNEDGTDAEMLTRAVGFLGEFQQQMERTVWFMDQLRRHELLMPRNIYLEKQDKSINLHGLWVIDEEKLTKLNAKIAMELLSRGVLGWAYAHLLSLQNIDRFARRLDSREQGEPTATVN